MLPVEPRSRPGFRNPDRAWDYYRRGIPEWYMWWGNNVYSYDRAALVVSLGHVSRSLEELGGIAEGVHPMVNVMPDERNSAAFAAMRRLRWTLLAALALAIVAVLGMVACAVGWWRSARRPGERLDAGAPSPRSLAK